MHVGETTKINDWFVKWTVFVGLLLCLGAGLGAENTAVNKTGLFSQSWEASRGGYREAITLYEYFV